MNTIRIGSDERPLEEADAEWIAQEVNRRRKDGLRVCVRVTFSTDELDFSLATPACAGGGGGGRAAVGREVAILNLWKEQGLDKEGFSPGGVISFVRRVENYL